MSDEPSTEQTATEVGDLEYDLAHEAAADLRADAESAPVEPSGQAPSNAGSMPTRGYDGGDYGYDMAHDN